MTPEKLRDYRYWYENDLNAEQILKAVQGFKGGWKAVFPKGIPCWASRLRNYFNILPDSLMRFDWQREQTIYKKNLVDGGFMAFHALHGAVYKDEKNRVWLQMATAAGVYHYEGEVNKRKKAAAFLKPQMMMPIFKLVSPDGTGGSLELVLTNPKGHLFGDSTVVDPLHWKKISDRIVDHWLYEGSYNYAETVTVGYDNHVKADVDTHREWPGFYINPDQKSPLKDREFPERDGRGALLFEQIKYISPAVNSSPKRTNIIPRNLAASSLPPVADPDNW